MEVSVTGCIAEWKFVLKVKVFIGRLTSGLLFVTRLVVELAGRWRYKEMNEEEKVAQAGNSGKD
jgi:hypothetical protein